MYFTHLATSFGITVVLTICQTILFVKIKEKTKSKTFKLLIGGIDEFEEKIRKEEETKKELVKAEEERRQEITQKTRSRLSKLLDKKRAEAQHELEK